MVAPGSDVLDRASRAGLWPEWLRQIRQVHSMFLSSAVALLVAEVPLMRLNVDSPSRSWSNTTSRVGPQSRSSRLAHGGLRYLEQREFSLVHEALTERGLLLDRLAPHLVRPVPFLYPVTRRGWERPYVGFGNHGVRHAQSVGCVWRRDAPTQDAVGQDREGIAPGIKSDA